MNQETKELKERFEEVVSISDAEVFFHAFCEFLRFISDTPSLKRHANKILKERHVGTTISAVNILFSELNKGWEDDYDVSKKIWADLSRKMIGSLNQTKTPLIFSSLQSSRSASRVFYTKLLKQIENPEHSHYGKVHVVVDKIEQSIYLAKDKNACYSIKSRKRDKSKAPKRFRLVCVLLSQKSGVSIARLNELLDGANDTQNLKSDIKDVNRLFQQKVSDGQIVNMAKRGNKNMYSLNKDGFIFELIGS